MSKLKYEDVKKEVEKEGWQLLSTDYANLKTDMSFKCPEGHVNYYSLEKWRRGHICVTCKENPYINIKTGSSEPVFILYVLKNSQADKIIRFATCS